jgi:putative ABC transport system substrate-binding protein
MSHLCRITAATMAFGWGSRPRRRRWRSGRWPALDAIAGAQIEAVNVLASPLLQGARFQIIDRMRDHRVPAIYQWPETAEEGGLLAYGPRILLCYRHVVSLVDKVLRGAKPADLPIEQPTKFELVANLKTASALGMTISPALLLRADEVIE